MIYWLHRLGAPLAKRLPLGLCYGLAALIAPITFALWREKRENALRNMAQVLGAQAHPREVQRLALRSFVNYGKYLIDMLRLTGVKGAELEHRITVEGWDHFQRAVEKGSGLIFVGGHIGNSDLAAALLAGRGFPVHVITEPLEPPRWDALVQAAREAVGLTVIPMGSALRSLRVLHQKGILAFLIDRPLEDEGVMVQFFGGTIRVPAGAAGLALRSNAQVLGAYIVREGRSYVARIDPAIAVPTTGDHPEDLRRLTQAIFDWLERVIRQYPDQWFMFRRMWPPGKAED